MNDPITLFDIGSSLHQEYISKASGNTRRKALKKITRSNKSHSYNWLSSTVYLSWVKHLARKAKKRMATPCKCTCPS
jgi:hypothetical protein